MCYKKSNQQLPTRERFHSTLIFVLPLNSFTQNANDCSNKFLTDEVKIIKICAFPKLAQLFCNVHETKKTNEKAPVKPN